MINSYPASLITVTAAFIQARLLHMKKDLNRATHKKSKVLKLNDKQTDFKSIVGIKFDNILPGKYFALIQSAQKFS
jgi:hypothetical protein